MPSIVNFNDHDLTLALLMGTLVILVAVAAVRLSVRTGLPSLLIYLGIGLAMGEGGFGIEFGDRVLTQVLSYSALVLILIEGGLTTKWEDIRSAVWPAISLATAGVVVSVAVVGALAHLALGLSWTTSLLIGAILASTDAAAVFAVLRNVPLPRRVRGMLEAESGFNDAPVVILVASLSSVAATSAGVGTGAVAGAGGAQGAALEVATYGLLAVTAVVELVGGGLIGLAVGWVGARAMRRVAGGTNTLFAIGVVAVAVLAYAVADLVHTSGFIACYLAALLLGNLGLPHRPSVVGFGNALGWLAQIGLFVLLGLLASPKGFPAQVVPALIVGAGLLFVARPLSVFVSTAPFGFSWRVQAFLSWAGLRGAVPVVLATVPVTSGVPGVRWIFDLVFVLVVIFTLVQGPTLPWMARRLGLREAHHQVDLDVETTSLDAAGAELIEVTVGEGSRVAGLHVRELRLPAGASVALVVRGRSSFVPSEPDTLREGDRLIVVAPSALRARTLRRLHALSRDGRLAGWTRPAD